MTQPFAVPYVVGQWVRGGRFYGRAAQLSEVLEGPRESLWLLGTRRIGKTSLLKQLEHVTATGEQGYMPLFWDLQGADEPGELHLSFHDALLDAEERLAQADVDLSRMDPADLFGSLSRLRRQVHGSGRKLLLLCDEVEELIELADQDRSLLRKLRRSLQSGGEMRSVLTSTIRLWALADQRQDTSPFLHGFAPPVYLATLTDGEARSLLCQEHLPEASRPRISSAQVEEIRGSCDNHPYLLQLVAKRFLEVDDVAEAIERVATDEMVSYFFRVDYEMLSPAEQKILRSIGETAAASSASLEGRLDLEASQLTGSLLRLEGLGFLRRDREGDLVLANRLFRRWVAELPAAAGDVESATSLESTPIPELLDGRYEILDKIGEGATGIVYLANDRVLKTRLALKVLKPEYSDHPQVLDRFRQEIVLSRDIAHPNILRVYHLGLYSGRRYLTMQWVEGPTLAQVMQESAPLVEEQVLAIGIKLASALEAAHGRGVLHRDIKPQNILLDASGEPILTDFGLARQVDDPGITLPGMFLGTPLYVSPEQARAVRVDERSDLYSLGVVLFEMATGQRPFTGLTIGEVLEQHRVEQPPEPQQIRPDLSPAIANLILRCLEKDPDRRFASARELRQELETLARRSRSQ